MRKVLFAFALVLLSAAARAEAFDPVGLWRYHDEDGKIFYGRLYPDQRAVTTFEGGEVGIWRVEGDSVRALYTDGWDDLLTAVDGGFAKRSWGPGADRCGPPTNENKVEHLSADPDAPLPN